MTSFTWDWQQRKVPSLPVLQNYLEAAANSTELKKPFVPLRSRDEVWFVGKRPWGQQARFFSWGGRWQLPFHAGLVEEGSGFVWTEGREGGWLRARWASAVSPRTGLVGAPGALGGPSRGAATFHGEPRDRAIAVPPGRPLVEAASKAAYRVIQVCEVRVLWKSALTPGDLAPIHG